MSMLPAPGVGRFGRVTLPFGTNVPVPPGTAGAGLSEVGSVPGTETPELLGTVCQLSHVRVAPGAGWPASVRCFGTETGGGSNPGKFEGAPGIG